MTSTGRAARAAGLLYLLSALIALVGLLYVPRALIVPGDATATADRLRASGALLRLGIASELLSAVLFVFVVLALYALFKEVGRKRALAMATLLLVSVPISCLNVLNELAARVLVGGATFLSAFEPRQLDTLAFLSSVCTPRASSSPRSSGGCGCSRSEPSSSTAGSSPGYWASA